MNTDFSIEKKLSGNRASTKRRKQDSIVFGFGSVHPGTSPLLFAEETDTLPERHPVRQAQPTPQAKAKRATKRTDDGFPAQSFRSLLQNLATIAKNVCRLGKKTPPFEKLTKRTPLQTRAFSLLKAM